MKLSIITINYNNLLGFQRTMNSILTQTTRDFEWIIIDGGSTDGLKELLTQNDNEITYWCSEPDNGIYNAMNKGVQHANGEYCLFLNSGDILCAPNIMEKISEISFQSEIVSFDMYVDTQTSKGYRKFPDFVDAYWLYDHYLPHPSSWIKRKLLLSIPYDETYRIISDWIFFYEALVMCDCSYQHVATPISVFYRDGISCDPIHMEQAYMERKRYLQTRFPKKYIDDKEKNSSFHYISVGTSQMSSFCQRIMVFVYRLVVNLDQKIFNRHN